jgi:hypothetical protein
VLNRLELGNLHRTQMDFGRASVLELRGGLSTSREVLQPSESHHSLDEAMPSYFTKNESFENVISKMWCVCLLISTIGGIYRVVGELHQPG